MSTIVQVKRSETPNAIPSPADLAIGELAINLADKKIFSKDSSGLVVEFISQTSASIPQDFGYLTDIAVTSYDFGLVTEAAG